MSEDLEDYLHLMADDEKALEASMCSWVCYRTDGTTLRAALLITPLFAEIALDN